MSATTAEENTDHSLPSFASFTTDLEPTWDWDRQDRSNSGSDVISSQTNNSYTRPWEMESNKTSIGGGIGSGFEPFPKLPSFQSQFHSFSDTALVSEPSLPQVTG